MVALVQAAIFIGCVIAIALIGNPEDRRVDIVARPKMRRWRKVLVAIEILAGLALVWELGVV